MKEILPFYGEKNMLSNLYLVEEGFYFHGRTFYSSEQAYGWQKADFFDDPDGMRIMEAETDPHMCKTILRGIPHNKMWDKDEWERVKFQFMWNANFAKYSVPRLKEALKATEDFYLAESAPRDTYWGTGYGKDRTANGESRGSNNMGKILMEIRKIHLICED